MDNHNNNSDQTQNGFDLDKTLTVYHSFVNTKFDKVNTTLEQTLKQTITDDEYERFKEL